MAYTITILDSDEITDLRYGVGSKAFNEFIELLGITLNGALLTDESTLSHFFLSIPTSKEIIELAGSSYPDGYFAAKDLWDAEISAKINQHYGTNFKTTIHVTLPVLIGAIYDHNTTIH